MSFDWSFGTRAANGAGERLIEARAASAMRCVMHPRASHMARTRVPTTPVRSAKMPTRKACALRDRRESCIEQRPLEAVLIVGLASFAIGWVLRRLKEPAAPDPRDAGTRRASGTPARRRADDARS